MLTSIGSRSSRRTRPSTAAWSTIGGAVPLGHRGHPRTAVGPARLAFARSCLALPRRLPLGDRHRRPPDRGRQLEQRLVGLGAHARLGLRRAVRRRLRLAGTGGPRTSRSWPSSASATTASRSSGAGIEPEEGEWSTATVEHYRRQCEALLDAGVDPVVTFHHFTTPRWLARQGRLDRARHRRPVRRLLPTGSPASSADVLRRACTINEPNIVSTMGHLAGVFPPGRARRAAPPRASTACSSTPTARRSTPSARRRRACRSASRCR